MKLREIEFRDHGICVEHDQPCCIFPKENAVLIMGRSYFQPSWKAQRKGYRVIRCTNFIHKIILKYLFPKEFSIGEGEE